MKPYFPSSNPNKLFNQQGIAHIILLSIAAIGIIAFVLVSSNLPLKDKLFGILFPKPSSEASLSQIVVEGYTKKTGTGENTVYEVSDTTVKLKLTSPYGLRSDFNYTPQQEKVGYIPSYLNKEPINSETAALKTDLYHTFHFNDEPNPRQDMHMIASHISILNPFYISSVLSDGNIDNPSFIKNLEDLDQLPSGVSVVSPTIAEGPVTYLGDVLRINAGSSYKKQFNQIVNGGDWVVFIASVKQRQGSKASVYLAKNDQPDRAISGQAIVNPIENSLKVCIKKDSSGNCEQQQETWVTMIGKYYHPKGSSSANLALVLKASESTVWFDSVDAAILNGKPSAALLSMVANRLGTSSQIDYWAIDNEPNYVGVGPSRDIGHQGMVISHAVPPSLYAIIYNHYATAIKQAATLVGGDPNFTKVMSGGLAGPPLGVDEKEPVLGRFDAYPTKYIEAWKRAHAAEYDRGANGFTSQNPQIDILDVHYYKLPGGGGLVACDPNHTGSNCDSTTKDIGLENYLKKLREISGLGNTPIWFGEIGTNIKGGSPVIPNNLSYPKTYDQYATNFAKYVSSTLLNTSYNVQRVYWFMDCSDTHRGLFNSCTKTNVGNLSQIGLNLQQNGVPKLDSPKSIFTEVYRVSRVVDNITIGINNLHYSDKKYVSDPTYFYYTFKNKVPNTVEGVKVVFVDNKNNHSDPVIVKLKYVPPPSDNNKPQGWVVYPGENSTTCTASIPGTITGWSCDVDNPTKVVQVDFWDYSTNLSKPLFIGSSSAKESLYDGPELRSLCNPNGDQNQTMYHGFKFIIPTNYHNTNIPIHDGKEHKIRAYGINIDSSGAKTSGNTQLKSLPGNSANEVTIKCASTNLTSPTPKPVDNNKPIGYVVYPNSPSASCSTITGWSCDLDKKNKAIQVDLWDYTSTPKYLGAVSASIDLYNGPDLQSICGHPGVTINHGYRFNIPSSIKDNTTHKIRGYGINIDSYGLNLTTGHTQLTGIPANLSNEVIVKCAP